MPGQSKVLIFLEGLTDLEGAQQILLDEGTVNFYPTGNGYLQNYAGRADYFERTRGAPPATDTYGVPPSTISSVITKVTSFVDYLGVDHIVIVRNNELMDVVGNTAKVIFTFRGKLVDGAAYPEMFIHESKLIILNEGDFPLLWDGVDGVSPLGVQETPNPPVNVFSISAYISNTVFAATSGPTDPYLAGNINGYWEVGKINTGPTSRVDSSDVGVVGMYRTVVQYIDKYGNHGRVSASSPTGLGAATNWQLLTNWAPPSVDPHIHSIRQGRTQTLNPDDKVPVGVPTVFYTEVVVEGTTLCRRIQRVSDGFLASGYLIDMDVSGPPTSVRGASFGQRIWLVDRDGLVWYSDILLFGQFRVSQTLRPYSQTVAIMPAGDRIFLIGEHSTEVWYEGDLGPQQLEQDIENGSKFGTTFVAVGDGAIFGLWNDGFGFYDGKEHKKVVVPHYIQSYYVGQILDFVQGAEKIGKWYMLSIKKDHITDGNNVILMFNFETMKWFVVEESVNDIHAWNGEVVGVDDSLYVLFRPGAYPASTVQTAGIVPESVNTQRTITNLSLFMVPSSYSQSSLEVLAEEYESEQLGNGWMCPILSVNRRVGELKTPPYWNKPGAGWPQYYSAPKDVLLTYEIAKPVPGYQHKLRFDFPAGQQIKIKGIELIYSNQSVTEER